ncbi:MAG: carboxypeptidase-like regulatory domain-containing protein [Nitrospira sp.]|nr:carboxypeptidase-like regulatory domain-containing protein [Nitrospira sp.]
MIGIVSFALVLLINRDPLIAAELAGKVYRGGIPAANLSITVEGKNVETRTDGKGEYRFDLPPGNYTLIIRGQRFTVTVSPEGTRQDIRL